MKGLIIENKSVSLTSQLDPPKPAKNEVLVKIMCASVNPTDLDIIQGKYDFWLKLSGGYHAVRTGLEFSGIVIEGAGTFKPGDRVFGYVHLMKGLKTHQEHICIPVDYIALMPDSLNFEQAAGLPLGALTSLVALEEIARIQPGTRLLVNGAAGGLGVYCLQLARILGAHTTAIAGVGQEDFLLQLGADEAYNYQSTSMARLKHKFDVCLDLSNTLRFNDVSGALTPNGIFIPLEPDKHVWDFIRRLFSAKKMKYLMVSSGHHQKLMRIASWVEEGKLQVYVDSVYALADYKQAFQRLAEKGKKGRVVMRIAENG